MTFHQYIHLVGLGCSVQQSKANMFMHAGTMTPGVNGDVVQKARWLVGRVSTADHDYATMSESARNNNWFSLHLITLLINKPAYNKFWKENTPEILSHASKLEIESRYRILEISVKPRCTIRCKISKKTLFIPLNSETFRSLLPHMAYTLILLFQNVFIIKSIFILWIICVFKFVVLFVIFLSLSEY